MSDSEFKFPVNIYYEDTDAGGIVYHANYLKFAERARSEFIKSGGITNKKLLEENNILIVVRGINLDYKKPAFLDDSLMVNTRVLEIKNSSFAIIQTVLRDDIELVRMEISLVCTNSDLKPVRVPDFLREFLSNYIKKE